MRWHRGFSLIELLIVVSIISILAGIAVPNFLQAQIKSKVARAKSDMRALAISLESYRADHNVPPPDVNSGAYGTPPMAGEEVSYSMLTSPVAYMATTPVDPFARTLQGPGHLYEYYEFKALERTNPPWLDTWQSRGLQWYVYSWGPTGHRQLLAEDQTPAVVTDLCYDPTNGTVSEGNFGRSTNGMMPVG